MECSYSKSLTPRSVPETSSSGTEKVINFSYICSMATKKYYAKNRDRRKKLREGQTEKSSIAKVYKTKNSKVKDELNFRTKESKKKRYA